MAVYTHISEEDAKRHLSRYALGDLVSLTGITEGIDNTNYRLTTTQGRFILTLFESRIRAEDLPFYLRFMGHLHGKGIPCPAVLRTRTGEEVVMLQNRPAAITSFLEGAGIKKIEPAHTQEIGGLLARMHLGARDFGLRRANSLSLAAWKSLISRCGNPPELAAELDFLEKNWPQSLPQGAVHADLFPDNVFFNDGKISGVIDFYFACTECFAYDLMLTLNAWCFDDDGQMDPRRTTTFLDAYQALRPLSAEEKKSLPFFGRAAALRIIATRLYDRQHPVKGALVAPKDPQEYVRILTFHQSGGFAA